ncbi:MAG: DUF1653 domain-containing protein [Clostridia bacterium]|nr:DUF1653 domain-containing protein [Clostridia bacterium]
MYWVNESVFYHIYPLGFCGAPRVNDGKTEYRLNKVIDFIPHLKEMHVNAVYFGPVFMSTTHGYDTNDYYHIDNRLGDNESFAKICAALHENGIKVVLDGVFNHVGRGFWAFEDVRKNHQSSPYCSWFQNLNFGGSSPWGDPFWYEGWEGNYDLVKLNLRHPDVKKHIFDAVAMWMDKFKIDGLRLDVAYCMDQDFLRELKHFCKSRDNQFWLMGEIIHGDYARLANPDLLDSCTNYECYKGIYSSHNDRNYFEIAHSLNRQFANGGIYHNIYTYNFVDNHDVNRLASTLRNPEHLKNAFSTVYFMPGVPSVYYGSEWGIKGQKSRTEYDYPLRPCVNVDDCEDNALYRHVCRLGAVRRTYKALQYGSFENTVIRNEQLVFKRRFENQSVYVALNLGENAFDIGFRTDNGTKLYDVYDGKTVYDVQNNYVNINIPAYGTRVLVLTDGEAPAYPDDDAQTAPVRENVSVPAETVPAPVQEERKPLPAVGTPGKYRHFKGGEYEFVCLAKDSETSEELVIYKALYGDGAIWARPSAIFYQYVNVDGKEVPRFEKIDD